MLQQIQPLLVKIIKSMNKIVITLFLFIPSMLQAQKGFFYVKPTFNTKLHQSEYSRNKLFELYNHPLFYNEEDLSFKKYNWYNFKLFNNIQIGINLGYKFSNSKTSIEIGYQQDQAISGFRMYYSDLTIFLEDTMATHHLILNNISRYSGTSTNLITLNLKSQIFDYSNKKIFGRISSLGCKMNLNIGTGLMLNQTKGIYPEDNTYTFEFTNEKNDYYLVNSVMYPQFRKSMVFILGLDFVPKYKNRELLEIGFSYIHGFKSLSEISIQVIKNHQDVFYYSTTSKGSGIKLEFSKRINVSKIFRKEKSE